MSIVQFHKYPCSFCKKNEATQLCDFVVDYSGTLFLSPRMGGIQPPQPDTCDNQICKECAFQYNGHEFCPSCKELHALVKKNHDKRRGNLMMDMAMGKLKL